MHTKLWVENFNISDELPPVRQINIKMGLKIVGCECMYWIHVE